MGCFAELMAFQSTGKPAIHACTLLTKDVVIQNSPYDKQVLNQVMAVPASENAIGVSGSECTYGAITMQVDPFLVAVFENSRKKETKYPWTVVQGVGETAYYRDNGGRWGELFVASGGHVLTIQMGIPTGKSAASIQPNVIALAKTTLPKLK